MAPKSMRGSRGLSPPGPEPPTLQISRSAPPHSWGGPSKNKEYVRGGGRASPTFKTAKRQRPVGGVTVFALSQGLGGPPADGAFATHKADDLGKGDRAADGWGRGKGRWWRCQRRVLGHRLAQGAVLSVALLLFFRGLGSDHTLPGHDMDEARHAAGEALSGGPHGPGASNDRARGLSFPSTEAEGLWATDSSLGQNTQEEEGSAIEKLRRAAISRETWQSPAPPDLLRALGPQSKMWEALLPLGLRGRDLLQSNTGVPFLTHLQTDYKREKRLRNMSRVLKKVAKHGCACPPGLFGVVFAHDDAPAEEGERQIMEQSYEACGCPYAVVSLAGKDKEKQKPQPPRADAVQRAGVGKQATGVGRPKRPAGGAETNASISKVKALLDLLEQGVADKYTHLLVSDTENTAFSASPVRMLEAFEAHGTDVLFAGTKTNLPSYTDDSEVLGQFEDRIYPWGAWWSASHLHSDVFIARRETLPKYLKIVHDDWEKTMAASSRPATTAPAAVSTGAAALGGGEDAGADAGWDAQLVWRRLHRDLYPRVMVDATSTVLMRSGGRMVAWKADGASDEAGGAEADAAEEEEAAGGGLRGTSSAAVRY